MFGRGFRNILASFRRHDPDQVVRVFSQPFITAPLAKYILPPQKPFVKNARHRIALLAVLLYNNYNIGFWG